jgi:hypothetical protein
VYSVAGKLPRDAAGGQLRAGRSGLGEKTQRRASRGLAGPWREDASGSSGRGEQDGAAGTTWRRARWGITVVCRSVVGARWWGQHGDDGARADELITGFCLR